MTPETLEKATILQRLKTDTEAQLKRIRTILTALKQDQWADLCISCNGNKVFFNSTTKNGHIPHFQEHNKRIIRVALQEAEVLIEARVKKLNHDFSTL